MTKRLLAAERRRKAWRYKLEGRSFDEVGRLLGISNAQAHRDIHHRLDELDEEERQEAKLYRRQIIERDEAIIERLYPVATGDDLEATLEATRALLLVHREMRAILALDAPTRTQLAVEEEPPAFRFEGPNDVKLGLRILREWRDRIAQEESNARNGNGGSNGSGNGTPPS